MPLISPASELESPHSRCSAGSSVVYAAKPVMLKISAPHMSSVSRTGVSRVAELIYTAPALRSSSAIASAILR